MIAQGLLSLLQARTLSHLVLADSNLPDAINIMAQLLGVDEVRTKINGRKPAIARLVLEERIAIDGGGHD